MSSHKHDFFYPTVEDSDDEEKGAAHQQGYRVLNGGAASSSPEGELKGGPKPKEGGEGVESEKERKKARKQQKRKQMALQAPLPSLGPDATHFPWAPTYTKKLGRHALVTRPIKAGELVLREEPAALALKEEEARETCFTCLEPAPLRFETNREGRGLRPLVHNFCNRPSCQPPQGALMQLPSSVGANPSAVVVERQELTSPADRRRRLHTMMMRQPVYQDWPQGQRTLLLLALDVEIRKAEQTLSAHLAEEVELHRQEVEQKLKAAALEGGPSSSTADKGIKEEGSGDHKTNGSAEPNGKPWKGPAAGGEGTRKSVTEPSSEPSPSREDSGTAGDAAESGGKFEGEKEGPGGERGESGGGEGRAANAAAPPKEKGKKRGGARGGKESNGKLAPAVSNALVLSTGPPRPQPPQLTPAQREMEERVALARARSARASCSDLAALQPVSVEAEQEKATFWTFVRLLLERLFEAVEPIYQQAGYQPCKGMEPWAVLPAACDHAQWVGSNHNAMAVLPLKEVFNHSCAPNCVVSYSGSAVVLHAVREVKVGEQLTIWQKDYLQRSDTPRQIVLQGQGGQEPRLALKSRRHRQAVLRDMQLSIPKGGPCACERCTEPLKQSVDRFLEALVCSQEGCKGVCISDLFDHGKPLKQRTFRCLDCGAAQPQGAGEAIEGAEQQVQDCKKMIARGQMTVPDGKKVLAMLEGLQDARSPLHRLHETRLEGRAVLIAFCRANQEPEKVASLAEEHAAAVAEVLGSPSQEECMALHVAGCSHIALAEQSFPKLNKSRTEKLSPASSRLIAKHARQAKHLLDRAFEQGLLCLGRDHPFVEETDMQLNRLKQILT